MSSQPTTTENMHKFVYLANEYPGHSMNALFEMFQMPLLDYTAAAYLAEDLGYVLVDKDKDRYSVQNIPEEWIFGDRLKNLINTLTFVFQRLEKNETDLNERELNIWMDGHPIHDQFISMKYLLNTGFLETYELKVIDFKGAPKVTNTFYCLKGNAKNQWGRKQFKNQKSIVG